MSVFEILFLSVALAMDCFSVSIVCGVVSRRWLPVVMLRMSFLFGLFQALMPLTGWLCTSHFSQYLEAVDHWIAFALLAFLGGRMIKESFEDDDDEYSQHLDLSDLRTQIVFAVATSIDALAVGISFACLGYSTLAMLAWPLTAIGIGSALFTILGCMLGIRFGRSIARRLRPTLFGGIVLLIIGIKILLSHLLGI